MILTARSGMDRDPQPPAHMLSPTTSSLHRKLSGPQAVSRLRSVFLGIVLLYLRSSSLETCVQFELESLRLGKTLFSVILSMVVIGFVISASNKRL